MIEKDSTCCFWESGRFEDLIRTLAALIGDCQPYAIASLQSTSKTTYSGNEMGEIFLSWKLPSS